MKLSDLSRQSTEDDVKKAYEAGVGSIEAIAEHAQRSVEEVLDLVFVDGEDGAVVDAREAAAEADSAKTKTSDKSA